MICLTNIVTRTVFFQAVAKSFIICSQRSHHAAALVPDMAEDEVTPEQLAAIAAENEEPEPVNYKPPAQKSVKEIQDLDKDDESLRKYKETLLGPGVTFAGNAVSGCWNGRTFVHPEYLSNSIATDGAVYSRVQRNPS